MSKNATAIRSYFEKLGFDSKIADIYVALQEHGPQSISELSRSSGVDRIQIYRMLDDLKASSLVKVETRYKRSIIHAEPANNIQLLISRKEQELAGIKDGYTDFITQLSAQSMQSKATKVQFYEGMDGLRQMLWDQTRYTGENLSILYDNSQHKTGKNFFERWVQSCNEQDIQFRGIIGDNFIKTQKDWYSEHSNERLKNWESRYAPEDVFPISYSIITYADKVLHFNWNDERIFGIEIENPDIARVQRQFFNMLWGQLSSVNDLVGPSSIS
jgi:DNA-binding MarR family transcriptional regulator